MDWYGNETLHNTPLSNITLDGTPIAAVANVDNFSFAYVPSHCSFIHADPIETGGCMLLVTKWYVVADPSHTKSKNSFTE